MTKSDQYWQKKLSPEQYLVLRKKGTEVPYTGALLHNNSDGSYACAGCGSLLFDSSTKFDAHCGWPSFFDSKEGAVIFEPDVSHGMNRIEALCKSCGGHLGHVFPDAPDQPTGQRYCINSVSLTFVPDKKE